MSADAPLVLTTKDELAFFRLCQIRGVLKMEKVGLKGRQGPIRPQIAAEFGLKPRDSYDKYIAVVQEKIDAMYAAKEAARK